jgi:hypothetical protein
MSPEEVAVLRRVRMTVPDASLACCELHLDGWPLLRIDGAAGTVAVNDLRASARFGRSAVLPPADRPLALAVRTGAVGGELFVLLDDVAAVFVVPEERGVHAEVNVVESATGRLPLTCSVRYRQLPAGSGRRVPPVPLPQR